MYLSSSAKLTRLCRSKILAAILDNRKELKEDEESKERKITRSMTFQEEGLRKMMEESLSSTQWQSEEDCVHGLPLEDHLKEYVLHRRPEKTSDCLGPDFRNLFNDVMGPT